MIQVDITEVLDERGGELNQAASALIKSLRAEVEQFKASGRGNLQAPAMSSTPRTELENLVDSLRFQAEDIYSNYGPSADCYPVAVLMSQAADRLSELTPKDAERYQKLRNANIHDLAKFCCRSDHFLFGGTELDEAVDAMKP